MCEEVLGLDCSLEGLAKIIQAGKVKNIIVLTGAGTWEFVLYMRACVVKGGRVEGREDVHDTVLILHVLTIFCFVQEFL